MSTNPEITALVSTLAELAVRNTASAIASRIQAWRARGAGEDVLNELTELINELINERAQLVAIAQAFQQELAGQRISDEEIAYIVEQLIPTIEKLLELSDDDGSASESIELIKGLVSKESMTILQLVGFNFREALGAPLTQLVGQLILSKVPGGNPSLEQARLEQQAALFNLMAANPDALEQIQSLDD